MTDGRASIQRLLQELRSRRGGTWAQMGTSTIRGWANTGVPKRPSADNCLHVDRLLGWEDGTTWYVIREGIEPPPTVLDREPDAPATRSLVQLVRAMRETVDEMARVVELEEHP